MKICMYQGYLRNRRQLLKECSIDEAALGEAAAALRQNKTHPFSRRELEEAAILLAGYRRWGKDIGLHLHGSFAFVIRDDDKEEIFAIRDAFGLEPFYYSLTGDGRFLYGTSIGVIKDSPGFRRVIDPDMLQLYTVFGYPIGQQTIYKGIQKLMPGHSLLFREGKCRISRWYTPHFCPNSSVSEEEWIDRIDDTFRTILKEDRENFDFSHCASFLSGGVDSSYLLASSGIKRAYGIGYEESGFSEADLARGTAAVLDVDFHALSIHGDEFFDAIPQVMRLTELPTSDASTIALAIGCQKLAEMEQSQEKPGSGGERPVCFSGEGADEFFAGYHVYRETLEEGMFGGGNSPYFGCSGLMEPEAARRLLQMETAYPCERLLDPTMDRKDMDPLSRMLLTDLTLWFEGDILFGAGRAAGGAGLQVRMPYADRRMFELSARIPSSLKLKEGCGKYVLRKAAARRLPEKTAFRRKIGFAVPIRLWLRQVPYRNRVEETLFGSSSMTFFDQRLLKKIWKQFLDGNEDLWSVVYGIYAFLVWYENSF